MCSIQTKGKKSMCSVPLKGGDLQTLYTEEILLEEYRKKTGVNNRKANRSRILAWQDIRETLKTPGYYYRMLLGKVRTYRLLLKGLLREWWEKKLKYNIDTDEPSNLYRGKVITR